MDFLAAQKAAPADPDSPPLYVSDGVLSEEAERYVASDEYDTYPYCLLLGVADALVQRYHDGSARYLTAPDVVFEARTDAHKDAVRHLCNGTVNSLWQVDELEPGVPLAVGLKAVPRIRATATRKGFVTATLQLEPRWG